MELNNNRNESFPNETLFSGSKKLLSDVCNCLRDYDFLVVGGWGPYFLSLNGSKKHPGTHDVDILFKSPNTIDWRNINTIMKRNGFTPSAKHAFQFWKAYPVTGSKETQNFLYNVDFLHPTDSADSTDDMYISRYEYPIKPHELTKTSYHLETISIPKGKLFFDHNLYQEYDISTVCGGPKLNVKFLDEVGIILSKAQSYKQKKRLRDAFDIATSIINGKKKKLIIKKLLGFHCAISEMNFDEIKKRTLDFAKNLINPDGSSYSITESEFNKVRNVLDLQQE